MQIILERLDLRTRIEQRSLAPPRRKVDELGLVARTYVNEAIRRHGEVLGVYLLARYNCLQT